MDKPTVIKGGVVVDDRGRVTFCNGLDMSNIKRFYMLENHQQGFVRAWHGHVEEAKWVACVSGVAVVGTVEMFKHIRCEGDTEHGPKHTYKWKIQNIDGSPYIARIGRYTLHPNGDVLYIPPGYANGHMNLVTGTRVLHFSNKTLEETKKDDLRFDAGIHGWVWEVKPR